MKFVNFIKKFFGIKTNYFVIKMVGNVVKLKSDKKEFTLAVKDGKVTYTVEQQPVEVVANNETITVKGE